MLDPRLFRTQLEAIETQLARRGFRLPSAELQALEARRKAVQAQTQALQNERNARSREIGRAKARGEDVQPLLAAVQHLGDDLRQLENALAEIQAELEALLLEVPNLLDADVPDGRSEADNVEIHRWGEPPQFPFAARDHVDLGVGLGLLDFEAAAKLAGSRFVTLKGPLARLQRALIQFMLDVHTTEHGYSEVYVPFLVSGESLRGTGQLPKFAQDLFRVAHDPALYLIPTAEVPVTNLVRDEILEADRLPLKWVCHTPVSAAKPAPTARTCAA